MLTLQYRRQLRRERLQDLPHRTAEHIAVKTLHVFKKVELSPFMLSTQNFISLMSGHSRRDGALISSKPSARRHRASQAVNRVTFDNNRVGAQAASRALQDLAGRLRYVRLDIP